MQEKPSHSQKERTSWKAAARKKKRILTWVTTGIVLLIGIVSVILWSTGGLNKLSSVLGLEDFSKTAEQYPFAMHVLDVGKADAILLECEGHFMLIDGGTVDQGVSVRQYLTRRGVIRLDYIVNTHPDKDHIGGLATVMERFPTDRFLTSFVPEDDPPNSKEYLSAIETAKKKHIAQQTVSAGNTISLGSARIEILAPILIAEDTNNNSIVMRVTYGETTFLLTGDAEEEEEKSLLGSGADLSADVLKVGHHGSNTSTTQQFLEAVSPQYAAISVGKDSNNLPKKKILQRLESAGATIFRTDLDGVILFGSDGEHIQVHLQNP